MGVIPIEPNGAYFQVGMPRTALKYSRPPVLHHIAFISNTTLGGFSKFYEVNGLYVQLNECKIIY